MVALLHGCHARPHIDDDAGTLVAPGGGTDLRGRRRRVCSHWVAYARGLHLDQHLTGLRPVQVNVYNLKRLALVQGNSGTSFHRNSRSSVVGELT